MRIAQVSPLYESVPPKLYGGTERIVSYLTEELVRQGHEVTLFATGDSVTQARLIAPWCCALRLQEDCRDQIAHHYTMLEMVYKEINNFDIVHYHIDYLHYPLSRRSNIPHISTLHGRLNIPDLMPLYKEYNDIPVVSISDSQRRPLAAINWQKTVYHGLPKDLYKPIHKIGNYFAFIGRFSPEKRVDRAIELAIKTGVPIKIAAKIEKLDMDYFENVVKPLLDHPLVEYVGEIGEDEKNEFLGNALAVIFLIDWPEPFGLVMIESMACGTPVIGWNIGSVPEIIDHGVSGYVVSSMEEAQLAVRKLPQLKRTIVRETFERRFSVERMTEDYLAVYQKMVQDKKISDLNMSYEGDTTL